ncbi:Maf family protein [Lachnospiraceae bacterium OttesenSCG-928-D06]|nr:Maf family protein [Lachnospiraceae bacterium OttesenSCG-928-D06]
MKKIILASASPRRKELLTQIGYSFEVCVSEVNEHEVEAEAYENPWDYAVALAKKKATALEYKYANCADSDILIIGADTIVVCKDKILGKPADEQDAEEMLTLLQGREHQVYTGVSLITKDRSVSFYEATTVCFYPMTKEEIKAYVKTKEPLDKAGAYGIQGACAKHIRCILGDYYNVVGLPIGRLYQEICKL